jgi:hypothetical protein
LAREIAERQAVLARLQAAQEQRDQLDRLNAEIEQLSRGNGVSQAASRPPAPPTDTQSLLSSGVHLGTHAREEDGESEGEDMSIDDTRSRRTGGSHPSTKAPLYQNPTPFKGRDLKEATMYLNAWRTIHELDPRRYHDERQKVLSASTFLAGEPQERWANEEAKKFYADDNYDFDDFEAFVTACVSDPHNRGFTLGLDYEVATQRSGQTVSSFAAYLSTLEEQLGAGYTDAQSARHLLNKLRPNIREDIMLRGPAWKSRADLIALATRFEQVSKTRSDRSAEHRADGQYKSAAKKQRVARVPPTQRDSRLEQPSQKHAQEGSSESKQGKCYNCGLLGHWAKDCRKPPRQAIRAVNAVAATADRSKKRAAGKVPRRKRSSPPV